MAVVELREHDREIYEAHLRDFLPEKLIDVHTHVWLARHQHRTEGPSRVVSWPDRVAAENPIEGHLEGYRLRYRILFGHISLRDVSHDRNFAKRFRLAYKYSL